MSLEINLLIHRMETDNPNADLHAQAKLFITLASNEFISWTRMIRDVSLGLSTCEGQLAGGGHAIAMGLGAVAGGVTAGLAASPAAIPAGAKAGTMGAQKIIDAISGVST